MDDLQSQADQDVKSFGRFLALIFTILILAGCWAMANVIPLK
jgi:hypothetical protein